MTNLDALRQAATDTWHRIIGDITHSHVTGDPVATLCGGRIYPGLVPNAGEGARSSLPMCPQCETIQKAWTAHLEAKAIGRTLLAMVETAR